jgi:hypothetical protein
VAASVDDGAAARAAAAAAAAEAERARAAAAAAAAETPARVADDTLVESDADTSDSASSDADSAASLDRTTLVRTAWAVRVWRRSDECRPAWVWATRCPPTATARPWCCLSTRR